MSKRICSSTLYICPCGRVFDKDETYELGSIPKYGKSKLLIKGKPVLCHRCFLAQQKRIPIRKLSVKKTVLLYLQTNKKVCSADGFKLGIINIPSFCVALNTLRKQGLINKVNDGERPLYYTLNKKVCDE